MTPTIDTKPENCVVCGAPIANNGNKLTHDGDHSVMADSEDDDLCAICEMDEQAQREWERDRAD